MLREITQHSVRCLCFQIRKRWNDAGICLYYFNYYHRVYEYHWNLTDFIVPQVGTYLNSIDIVLTNLHVIYAGSEQIKDYCFEFERFLIDVVST